MSKTVIMLYSDLMTQFPDYFIVVLLSTLYLKVSSDHVIKLGLNLFRPFHITLWLDTPLSHKEIVCTSSDSRNAGALEDAGFALKLKVYPLLRSGAQGIWSTLYVYMIQYMEESASAC
jgi:hypothetical protein